MMEQDKGNGMKLRPDWLKTGSNFTERRVTMYRDHQCKVGAEPLTLGQATRPKENPVAVDVLDGINSANQRIGRLIQIMAEMRDRIYGPTAGEKVQNPSTPVSGIADALKSDLNDLHDKINCAESLLDDLQRFV